MLRLLFSADTLGKRIGELLLGFPKCSRSLPHSDDPASHEMFAWRVVSTKAGKDGSSQDDFVVKSAFDDDGEKMGGQKILSTLEATGALDVAVVCSRWFGGQNLGPVRFKHIHDCVTEALQKLHSLEELKQKIEELREMDDTIATLCLQIGNAASPGKVQDYESTSLEAAKRLVNAKTQRIKHLRGVLERQKLEQEERDAGV